MSEALNGFLETDSIGKLMRKYAIPCITSWLVGALYNVVDQIFIANASYLGSFGNAANTIVFPLTVIALAIAGLVGDGSCGFISISLGEKRSQEAKKGVGNGVLMILIASLCLTGLFLLLAEPLVTIFGATVNEQTFAFSKEYFFYITLGLPFYMFGQAMNPIIRADGNPRFAMLSILAGAFINIILDPIFIFKLHWGMRGAALATVIGQIVTALCSVWYLAHMKIVRLSKEDFHLQKGICKKITLLGVTSFFTQFSVVIVMAASNNMIRYYGGLDPIFGQEEYAQIPMAVIGIVMKFFQITVAIVMGMATGCIPIAGYNIGAGKKKRVRELFLKLLLAEAGVGIVTTLIVECFPHGLIAIFGAANESSYYTEFAIRMFRNYLCLMTLACINKACFIFLQGIGKAVAATALSVTREVILGVGLVLLLPYFFGLDGVSYSMPVSEGLAFLGAMVLIVKTCHELGKEA